MLCSSLTLKLYSITVIIMAKMIKLKVMMVYPVISVDKC